MKLFLKFFQILLGEEFCFHLVQLYGSFTIYISIGSASGAAPCTVELFDLIQATHPSLECLMARP